MLRDPYPFPRYENDTEFAGNKGTEVRFLFMTEQQCKTKFTHIIVLVWQFSSLCLPLPCVFLTLSKRKWNPKMNQ